MGYCQVRLISNNDAVIGEPVDYVNFMCILHYSANKDSLYLVSIGLQLTYKMKLK